jgi:glutaredoxin
VHVAVLYSRQGCHTCDDAAALLARYAVRVEVVDIDSDPGLQARYGECVPVIFIDGKERFRGRIDQRLLGRLLAR